MTEQYALAALNFLLCGVGGVICICRLNAMSGNYLPVRRVVKMEYRIWVAALAFSAFRPWIGEWPGYATIVVDIGILWSMLASNKAWAGDAPPASATLPATLE